MNFQTISYIAALITALVGWYLAESIRRNNKANEASTLTSTALQIVNYKDKEIEILKTEILLLQLYISYLVDEMHKSHPDFSALKLSEFRLLYNDK